MPLLDLLDAAEGQPRGTPRRVRRQASGLVGVLKQRQVRIDLTGEIVRPAAARASRFNRRSRKRRMARLLSLVESAAC